MVKTIQQIDLQRLVRAYGLLAGTCDAERALVGTISRDWIASEVEQYIPLRSLPKAFFETPRGRDVLAFELYGGQNIDPDSIDVDDIYPASLDPDARINTNRIPKLEPRINCAVLVANILLGVQLYGRQGRGDDRITNDLIVAAMLQDAIGKPYRYSSLSSEDYEIVDEEYVRTWFGGVVAALTWQIREVLEQYEKAITTGEQPDIVGPAPVANAVAAVYASRLRLTARAVGDFVISYMDDARLSELTEKGLDTAAEFPERPILARDFQLAASAFALIGVDHHALRDPIRNTLLLAVEDVLEDPAKRSRLSGRRGKAVHDLHMNLPVMEYFVAAEAPNSLETIHLASLELMRSLDKGRRKSLSTMTAHAFRISALGERVLGHALEPLVVTLAMLHDVVEDGAMRVTGYNHSLRKVMFRFGAPIAAMVSELTDSTVETAGANKARKTFEAPHLLSPEQHYNVNRFTEMDVRPSDVSQPYTLSGIVIKLLDTVVSLEEGIRDPELMTGWWRHSGARIYWADQLRGGILNPLIERLVVELCASQQDPQYMRKPHHVARSRLRAGMALLEITLGYLDLYVTQNLAIVADEYGLDSQQRDYLITSFNDTNIDQDTFCSDVVGSLLTEQRLAQSIAAGRVPDKRYVTLYPKQCEPDQCADVGTFMSYRDNTLRRQRIRRELGLDTSQKLAELRLRHEKVLTMYDRKMAGSELRLPVQAAGDHPPDGSPNAPFPASSAAQGRR